MSPTSPDPGSEGTGPPDGTEVSDLDLLQAHVAGDPQAFGRLVTRHRDRLWAVALRTTGHPEEAADALQDALVSAFRRAESFRGDAAVTTWLHRIVVNASLDRLRRQGVRRAEPLPDDLDRMPPGALPTPPDPDDPERRALTAEVGARVREALRSLPEDQRTCLVLVDLEDWPVAEVAEHLGVPVGTVKSRCHRARAKLATMLPDLRRDAPGTTDATRPGGGTPTPPAASHLRDGPTSPPAPTGPDDPPPAPPSRTSRPIGGDPA